MKRYKHVKTITNLIYSTGKEYKNATVTHIEADGIVLKTESGVSKVYFVELPKEVQQRFHYDPEGADKARQEGSASSLHTSAFASGATACLDFATAKPALDNAAASLDAAVRAAKKGDTATTASQMRKAATSFRTAARAESADAAISHPLMRAADSYDKAAAEYAAGDETGAALYAAAAIEFVKTSNAASQRSSVPRCR